MKVSNVMNCNFSSWYSKFKDVTIKSLVIPLPQEFLDYLHADGVVLPESCTQVNSTQQSTPDDEDGDSINWDEEGGAVAVAPEFPDFEKEVKKTIQKLGGKVFPKLNWSAPRDATWISFDKTLKCTCPCDIYLLLKSSDFIAHDLSQPFIRCVDCDKASLSDVKYELVLRKWQDLQPGMEFRCFIKNKKLIGISQRHHVQYYDYVEKQKEEIFSDIKAFFYHVIANNFPDEDYIFDVYRREQGRMLIIDFNPFGVVTDPLLFSWDELINADANTDLVDKEPEFRYVQSKDGVQPNPYAYYALPRDFVDLAHGEDPRKLMDLLNLKIQSQHDDSSTDSDDQDVS